MDETIYVILKVQFDVVRYILVDLISAHVTISAH